MKITLRNTRAFVEGTFEEQAWLSTVLSVETGDMDFHGQPKVHSFYQVGQGSFPVGFVYDVLNADAPEGVDLEVVDQRTVLETPEIETVPGFEYFDFQAEALSEILSMKQGLVRVATNGGKSVIMAGLLRTLEETGVRGLVITHRQEIHRQLVETFQEALDGQVGVLTSEKNDVHGRQFVVAMARTLVNRLGDDPDVTDLFEEHEVLLADEAHHLQSATWSRLFSMSEARVKVGFSGTIPDPDTYQGWLVRQYTGPILIDVTNRELIEAGISATPTIQCEELDSSRLFHGLYKRCLAEFAKEHGNLFKEGGRWRNPHLKMRFFGFYQRKCIEIGVVRNERRNSRIADLVSQAVGEGKQALVIVNRIEHGKVLRDYIDEAGPQVVFLHGEFPGRAEVLADFKAGRLPVLVSTQILDEGVDIAGIDVLVLAGGMKCKRELLQRIGRGLRRKKKGPNVLTVIDFLDFGNRYLESYTKERQALFRSEGFKVVHVLESQRRG